MVRRNPSPTNRVAAPPLDREPLRQRIEQAHQAHAAREGRMDECEKYIRCWQTPPETLFDEWLEWCIAEGIDPVGRLSYLRRPLEDRLADLFYVWEEDWDEDSEPLEPDDSDEDSRHPLEKVIDGFCNRVLDDPERKPLVAEMMTNLEDALEEHWRRRACRSTWRVAEWEVATALVDVLRAVFREVKLYIVNLTGDEPECDPRIKAVWPLLREIEQRLIGITIDRPRGEPIGRPMVGEEKDWPAEVQQELLQLLGRILPWRNHEDNCSETEHKKMLGVLSEKILEALGIRGVRGIGSRKRQQQRPPSNPRHAIARRLNKALGVQRIRPQRGSGLDFAHSPFGHGLNASAGEARGNCEA